jgi:flap endonuclease-1
MFEEGEVMGINLRTLLEPETITLEELSGKIIALDAYNMIYQFLASIRMKDGRPLTDDNENVVSHLMGLLSRTSNLLKTGIKPVFVFDGVPHPLKESTITYRIMRKKEAMEEWKKALSAGDMERARSKAQQTSHFTHEMVRETKHVIELMGIPLVQAPSDGEAQASLMTAKGEVDATGSQDFDSLLFGSTTLIRNITMSGRRKMPGKHHYKTVNIEKIRLPELLKTHEITHEQLVDMAILIGTDFNEGIKGIGPKKSLKLIKKHGKLEEIMVETGYEIEHFQEIRNIFLNPMASDDYELIWKKPQIERLVELYVEGHQFKESTIKKYIEKIEASKPAHRQIRLDFF